MTKKPYLIITDDPDIGQFFQDYFDDAQAIEIHWISSLSQALHSVMKKPYCLLIIDLQVSDMDRIEMVRMFRIAKRIPILAVTEPLSADEKIALFRAGVNVFLERPINISICMAQANALAELYINFDDKQSKHDPILFGSDMIIVPHYRQVLIKGKTLDLTRKEFELLCFFAQHPMQVFSRSQLYEQVWNDCYELGGDETVKVHIKTLRKKLSLQGANLIENVWGVGYRFVPLL